MSWYCCNTGFVDNKPEICSFDTRASAFNLIAPSELKTPEHVSNKILQYSIRENLFCWLVWS